MNNKNQVISIKSVVSTDFWGFYFHLFYLGIIMKRYRKYSEVDTSLYYNFYVPIPMYLKKVENVTSNIVITKETHLWKI